jgi:hypothetical protein
MIKEISRKIPKSFDTAWSFQTIGNLSSKELKSLLFNETGITVTHSKTRKALMLEVLCQLNSPSRTVFNNAKTVKFKNI